MALGKKAFRKSASRGRYTYAVTVSFEMQYTFTEDDVEQGEEGDKEDVEPTNEALGTFENEIREHLQLMYRIDKLDAWTDFDHLLGVASEPPIDAAASADWEVAYKDSKGRPQYLYNAEGSKQRRRRGRAVSAKVKIGKRGKRNSESR